MSMFKRNLNVCLGDALRGNSESVRITPCALNDLKIWAGHLLDPDQWLPIPIQPSSPPIHHKVFVSDAAGISSKWFDSGVASIGFNEDSEMLFATQFLWSPKMLLSPHPDNAGLMGENSLFLEFVGVLIPFVLFPEMVQHQHIVCLVDNLGCFNGWMNKTVKNDVLTSILIRALILISHYLECIVHIDYLPRMSTSSARMADRMSRRSSLTSRDRFLLSKFEQYSLPLFFVSWLNSPGVDWTMPMDLLNHVRNKVMKT